MISTSTIIPDQALKEEDIRNLGHDLEFTEVKKTGYCTLEPPIVVQLQRSRPEASQPPPYPL